MHKLGGSTILTLASTAAISANFSAVEEHHTRGTTDAVHVTILVHLQRLKLKCSDIERTLRDRIQALGQVLKYSTITSRG